MKVRIWAKLIMCIAFIGFSNTANASHIIGGQFSYVYNGDDDYQIVLQLWRDCCALCADIPATMDFVIRNENGQLIGANGQLTNQAITVPLLATTLVDTGTEDPCFPDPPNICVEYAIYRLPVTLPDGPETFEISSAICCRNSTVVNIQDPGGTGATFSIDLPHDLPEFPANNNSAYFPSYPEPPLVCLGVPFISNMSAVDPDGDSLVYGLYTPFNDNFPNFGPVPWANGFNESDQMGGSPAMSIDPVTGVLTAFPDDEGQYVIGVTVSEYRDDLLVGTTFWDLQFNATECEQVNVTTGGAVNIIDEGVYEFSSCTELFYIFTDTDLGNANAAVEVEWLGVNDGMEGSPIGDFSGNAINPFVSFPEPGTYELQIAAGLGECKDTATVIFNMFPIEVDFNYNASDCGDFTVDFTDITDDPNIIGRTWNFGDPSQTDAQNMSLDENPSFTFSGPDTYTVSLALENTIGCTGELEIDVIIAPPPTANIATADFEICAGEDFPLEASFVSGDGSSGNIDWGPDEFIVDENTLFPTVVPTESTWIVFTYTNGSGCIAKDSVFATVLEQPVLDLPATESICEGFAGVMLDPNYGGASTSITWSPTTQLANPNSLTTMASPTTETTYVLTVSNGDCDATDEVLVMVTPALDLKSASNDTSICEENMVVLEVESSDPVTWSPSEGLDTNTGLIVEATPNTTTTYMAFVDNGCDTDTAFVTISVDEQPTLSAGEDIQIDLTTNTVGQFDGSSDYPATWSPTRGVDDSTDPKSTVLPERTRTYTLSATNGECTASDEVIVNIDATISVEVPSAFSPNGDGLNDVLNFRVNGIQEVNNFVVYNRWGEQLYQGKGFDAFWDGEFEGNKQPTGVYVYYIEAVTILGTSLPVKGNVTMLR